MRKEEGTYVQSKQATDVSSLISVQYYAKVGNYKELAHCLEFHKKVLNREILNSALVEAIMHAEEHHLNCIRLLVDEGAELNLVLEGNQFF